MHPYDPNAPIDCLATDPQALAEFLNEASAQDPNALARHVAVSQERTAHAVEFLADIEQRRYYQERNDRIPNMYAGGSVLISAVTQEETLLSIPSEVFDNINVESLTMAIDVVQDAASLNLVTDDHRPQVRFLWGSPKGRNLAAIDLINGTTINIGAPRSIQATASMSGFNIDDEFSWNGVAITTSPILRITASISLGGSDQTVNTFTDIQRNIAAGAAAQFAIPRYAVKVEIKHDADPFAAVPDDILLQFVQSIVGGAAVRCASGLRDAPISIPSGTQAIILNNLSAVNAINTQLVYHLSV